MASLPLWITSLYVPPFKWRATSQEWWTEQNAVLEYSWDLDRLTASLDKQSRKQANELQSAAMRALEDVCPPDPTLMASINACENYILYK